MDRIVGIVPAGGKARRIHGFFKEMMPIGVNDTDKSKFIVSSERIIERILTGGAVSAHFILSSQKLFVAQYFTNQRLFEGRVNFNFLSEAVEDLGMPYTIDSVFEQLRDFEYVMMGMPDTVIEPEDSFLRVHNLLREQRADLALGLYRTDVRNRGGYIEFDQSTKRVLSHTDKTSAKFPSDADNSWAIVCWNKDFTAYLHELVQRRSHPKILSSYGQRKELLFGDIIDAAIEDQSVQVVADFMDEQRGFYWDITEPEKYFQLLRHYSPGDASSELWLPERGDVTARLPRGQKRVFIGHGRSDCWHQLRDLLRDRLLVEWEEFNRISTAGVSTQDRLQEMIDSAAFAFLVMTAEEETAGGELRTRDNVIHEVGLFQGHLGFKRAIILVEEGCKEFSNIVGLTQIRFPRGNLMAKSEEIRRVLEREGIVITKTKK